MNTTIRLTKTALIICLTATLPAEAFSAGPQPFASPADAAKALVEAVDSPTTQGLVEIFGDNARELITSGDPVQDKNDLERFEHRVKELTAVSKTSESTATLVIGKEAWPFPIPLVKTGDKWTFDVAAGRLTLLDRRIGENELNAIKAAKAYAVAQHKYASKDHDGDGVYEYAQKVVSTPGKQDGLFWKAEPGEEESPLGELFAAAASEGYKLPEGAETGTRRPEGFHGYHYKILTGQGANAPGGAYSFINNGNMVTDSALVATPVKFGETGIMTFLVNSRGEVYQKPVLEGDVDSYNPDESWDLVR